jgi:hypothetical protein
VSATAHKLTPEIGWTGYCGRLGARRTDLDIVHLKQPHDWLDILRGAAQDYPSLVRKMTRELLAAEGSRAWQQVAVLSFSMGGLTALNVAHEIARLVKPTALNYLAFVSFGCPFGGTGFLRDAMVSRFGLSYIRRLYDKDATLQQFKDLLDFAMNSELSIMLHSLENDEMVSPISALLPAEWLYFASIPAGAFPGLRWGTFQVQTRRRWRAHDSLLSNRLALAYIDGIVDGLLPPREGAKVAWT